MNQVNSKLTDKREASQQEEPLSHINQQGFAKMVSVGDKQNTERVAKAQAVVRMQPETFARLKEGGLKKGDVLTVAQVAGIMGAKRTSDLIPMCHPLMLTGCDIFYTLDEDSASVHIFAEVKVSGQTGVEMEALTAATTCALTIYDMLKAMDQGIVITDICLLEKTGGKSGHYKNPQV